MYNTSDIRNGLKVELDSQPYEIVDFLHVKPGKGGAFIRTSLRNLETGAVIQRTFRATEKLKEADVEDRNMQYLYSDGTDYIFMDNETYDQHHLSAKVLGDAVKYMKENTVVDVLFSKGRPINVDIPIFMELRIKSTEPGFKGDTATGGNKPAVLETGGTIQVPLFISEGDLVKVDTRTGQYVERV